MVEVNLVPKIKMDLLRARQQKNIVSFVAILVAAASLAFVGILAIIVAVVQPNIEKKVDGEILAGYEVFKGVGGAADLLTIQDQLGQISDLTQNKMMASRIFAVLDVVARENGDNQITLSNVSLDMETKVLRLEAQSPIVTALESMKKTITRTAFSYTSCIGGEWVEGACEGGEEEKYDGKEFDLVPLVTEPPVDSGVMWSTNSTDGVEKLVWVLEMTLDEMFLSFAAKNVVVIGPTKQNVTDSVIQIPDDLFEEKATEGDE